MKIKQNIMILISIIITLIIVLINKTGLGVMFDIISLFNTLVFGSVLGLILKYLKKKSSLLIIGIGLCVSATTIMNYIHNLSEMLNVIVIVSSTLIWVLLIVVTKKLFSNINSLIKVMGIGYLMIGSLGTIIWSIQLIMKNMLFDGFQAVIIPFLYGFILNTICICISNKMDRKSNDV